MIIDKAELLLFIDDLLLCEHNPAESIFALLFNLMEASLESSESLLLVRFSHSNGFLLVVDASEVKEKEHLFGVCLLTDSLLGPAGFG